MHTLTHYSPILPCIHTHCYAGISHMGLVLTSIIFYVHVYCMLMCSGCISIYRAMTLLAGGGGTEPKISYYVTSPMQVRNQTKGWQSATDIHFSVLCNKNSLPMHTVTKLPLVLMPFFFFLPISGVSHFKELS